MSIFTNKTDKKEDRVPNNKTVNNKNSIPSIEAIYSPKYKI